VNGRGDSEKPCHVLPKMIKNVNFLRLHGCDMVEWEPINPGLSPVEYNFEFSNIEKTLILTKKDTVIYQKLKLNFTKSGNPLMAICVKIDNEEISYVRIKIKYGNYSNYVTDYLLVKDVRNVTEYLLVKDVREIQKREDSEEGYFDKLGDTIIAIIIVVVILVILQFAFDLWNAFAEWPGKSKQKKATRLLELDF